jgi:hypothetical protein
MQHTPKEFCVRMMDQCHHPRRLWLDSRLALQLKSDGRDESALHELPCTNGA